MSPEQARGRPVDKRTDIWSFGCVLYEMLTGRGPFVGETLADTLAAILEREPDWSRLPGMMPETIRLLLQRCLEKDPRERLRDIGDVCFELDRFSVQPAPPVDRTSESKTAAPRVLRSHGPLALGAGVVVLVAAVGAAVALRGGWPGSDVSEPPLQLTDFNDSVIAPSLSQDGRMLTFIRGADFGRTAPSGRVYVKLLPGGVPVELTHGPTGAGYPTFSPDAARIVYTVVMPGLKWDSWQVPVLGGPPQPFLPNASGLVWLDERRLVYSSIRSGLHMGVVSSTEARSEETTIYFPSSNDGMAHRTAPSRDGKSLLVVEMDRGTWQPCRLVPIDGSSTGRSVSPPGAQCTSAAWSPDGRWMYFSSNAGGEYHIWRQRYPQGAPDQITFGPTEQEGTAITPDGKYLITSMGLQRAGIWLVDVDGERALTDEGYAMFPTMTPSGARLFYLMRTQLSQGKASGELWSLDAQTRARQRILPEFVMANYSVSQDEKRVVFSSSGNERGDGIWIADLDRGSPPRLLVRGTEVRAFFGAPGEIVYLGEGSHVYRMKDDGSGGERVSANPVVYLVTVSPDGRWGRNHHSEI